jgi:ATP-binding cassette, subfamily F, member 3
VELRDTKSYSYIGNYSAYLAQNSVKMVAEMQTYETAEKRIENIKEQIQYANVKSRSRASETYGRSGKNPWVVMRERLEKELDDVLATHEKPSFWIDRESADKLSAKVTGKYEQYKDKNITLRRVKPGSEGAILDVDCLSLGYDGVPLFSELSFQLRASDKLHIIGRNGAGKTTLVRAIMDAANGRKSDTLVSGKIDHPRELRVSVYEQELGSHLVQLTLYDAVEQIYSEKNVPVGDRTVRQVLSQYLFDPMADSLLTVGQLSGGQKARLQLIRLLAGSPNLLILDEPTNHLDLPSIEELENALSEYTGAIIYVSHDDYLVKNLGGKSLVVG